MNETKLDKVEEEGRAIERIERLREIEIEANDLVERMKQLKMQAEMIFECESEEREIEIERQYLMAKINLSEARLGMNNSISSNDFKSSVSDLGQFSPNFSPVSTASSRGSWAVSPVRPRYSQRRSDRDNVTEVGSWSSIMIDSGNYPQGGKSSSSGINSGDSGEKTKTKSKAKAKRSKVFLTEEELKDSKEMVWIGTHKEIFHSQKCKHFSRQAKPTMMTAEEAIKKGFRLAKKVGGCCRGKFV